MPPVFLSVLLVCLIGLAIPIAMHLFQNKSIPGLRILGAGVLCAVGWAIGLFGEINWVEETNKLSFFYLKEVVYSITACLFFSFVRHYTRNHTTKIRILETLAYGYPILMFFSLMRNIEHGILFDLRYTSYGYRITPFTEYYFLRAIPLVIDAISIAVLFSHYRKAIFHHRFQTLMLIIIAIPIALTEFSSVYLHLPNFWVAFLLFMSGILFIWSYLSKGILSALPIGRDAIIQTVSQGMIVFDQQKVLVDINDSAVRILDLDFETVIGTSSEVILKDKLDIEEQLVFEDDSKYECELKLKGIWYKVKVAVIQDKQGVDLGRLITLTDVSDTKKVIEELKKQQERWAFHLSKTPMIYVEWDDTLKIKEWNDTAELMFGYQKQEVLGVTALNPLTKQSDEHPFSELLEAVWNSSDSLHAISPVHTRDAKVLYCDWFITPLMDSEGNLEGIAALGVDVTEGQRAILDILGMNQELESLFKALPDLFFRINKDGTIVGYKIPPNNDYYPEPNYYLLKSVWDTFPETVASVLMGAVYQAIKKNEIISIEYQLLLDGVENYFEARIVAVDSNQIVALVRNITERVLRADKLKRNNEVLAKYSAYLSMIQQIGTDNIARYNRQYEPLFSDYLEAGKRLFKVQSAIITRVVEDKVWIFAVSSNELLEMGMKFDINYTFEALIQQQNGPFYFTESIGVKILELPREVETFIGAPVLVNGIYFGSISFFNFAPRKENYESYEFEILKLMAKIVGIFISLQKEEQTRQTAERDLYANQERYKGLVESQNDIIIRTDPYNRITFANQAFYDTFTFSRNETEGRNIFSLLHVRPLDRLEQMAKQLNYFPHRYSLELEAETSFGWRWYQYESFAIHNEDGELLEIQSVARDIHERVLIEVALRQNEARFRNLASNSPDFIFIYEFTNQEPTIIYINRDNFLGYTMQEMSQRSFFNDTLHPDDRSKVLNSWGQYLNTQDSFSIEFRFKGKHGEWEWVESRQRVLERNEDGSLKQLLLTNSVITERKRAEDRIGFQALMLNQVNSAVIANDLDGRVIYWNSYAEEMFQYSRAEAMGQLFVDLVIPDDRREEYFDLLRIFMKIPAYESEFDLKRKDKSLFPIWASLRWVKDQTGQTVAAVGIVVDQTERIKARNELLRAKETAEAATREKSNFLAVMSHEIRTPMNTVIGYADLLSQTVLSDEQIDYVQTIRNSGENLLALLNNILDFSKLEQGKMELALQPMDILINIEETMELFYPDVRSKGLDMILHMPNDIPRTLLGDETRFKQIFINLIGNAVKFTKEGFISVSVQVMERANEQITLQFLVQDTGIGVPQEKMNRLFQPFSQADQFTTRTYGGTGLGLVICERLVRMMNGSIRVESEIKKGTTFCFTIPFGWNNIETNHFGNEATLKICNTLYLDPNRLTHSKYLAQLSAWGLPVISAFQMKEAFEWLRNHPEIQLLLVNNIDAYARPFCERIRQYYPKLKIILLRQSAQAYSVRVDDHLYDLSIVKPTKLSVFYERLTELLGAKNASSKINRLKDVNILDFQLAERFPLNILVAEDHPVNQKMIQLILSKMGYNPTIIENGVEAIEALDRERFDLIFMDVQMPIMDGLEATRKIMAKPPKYGVPIIIAMTANALNEDKQRCLEAGMRHYLTKPIKLDQVRSAIEQFGAEIISA